MRASDIALIASITVWLVAYFVELKFQPRLDLTDSGNLLLWYGIKERKYKVIL